MYPLKLARIVAVLALLVPLSGCPAAKLYKEGRGYDEAGKEYLAANAYLKALDANENHKKAKEALVAVAHDAYDEKLALAVSAERSEAYPKALEEFKELGALLEAFEEHNAVDFEVVNIAQRIEEMTNASAAQEYRQAEANLATRAWSDAIRHYQAAQGFRRDYKDTREKIAVAYYSWAEESLAGNRYRLAAERFALATESAGKGYRDAAVRSGTLYAALGKHFLGADRCRRAVKDLRLARDFLGADKVQADLARAEECAVTAVAILPFENPTGTNLDGMALGDTLSEATGAKVKAGASEFVRLMERSALDAILAEQGLSSAGLSTGATSKLRGVRYLVLGKLTQVKVDRPPAQAARTASTARDAYTCEKVKSDGTKYNGTCYRDVTVLYVDHRAQIEVRMAGSVKIVDVKTGEQLGTYPFEERAADAIHYADGFTDAAGNAVTPVGRDLQGGVEVTEETLALSKARRQLKTESELVSQVLAAISTGASSAVLKAVDVEREAIEPVTLPGVR